jgi:hypothetical protein
MAPQGPDRPLKNPANAETKGGKMSKSSTIETRLANVKITKGQGVSEGAFELSMEVQDDSGKTTTWPAYGSTAKISKGSTYTIDEQLALFTISGPVSKTYTVKATEVDGGLNGKDDFGQSSITLDLTPDMQLTPTSVLVNLAGGKHGQIQVGLTAGPPK